MQLKCLKGRESCELGVSEFCQWFAAVSFSNAARNTNPSRWLTSPLVLFSLVFSIVPPVACSHTIDYNEAHFHSCHTRSPVFATSTSNLMPCWPFRMFGRRQRKQEGGDKIWLDCRCGHWPCCPLWCHKWLFSACTLWKGKACQRAMTDTFSFPSSLSRVLLLKNCKVNLSDMGPLIKKVHQSNCDLSV